MRGTIQGARNEHYGWSIKLAVYIKRKKNEIHLFPCHRHRKTVNNNNRRFGENKKLVYRCRQKPEATM